jgi:hypothetical protein
VWAEIVVLSALPIGLILLGGFFRAKDQVNKVIPREGELLPSANRLPPPPPEEMEPDKLYTW